MNPTTFRATLYAIPLFLTPFVDKLGDLLAGDLWPSPQKLLLCSVLGVISTAIGLRAYYDGSAERAKQANQPKEPNENPKT